MMHELRLGDVIDDYCIKCRRLTNHAIVSLMEGQVAKVRCRSCYHDHNYLHEIAPPSKKDLKKAELFNAVLAQVDSSVAPIPAEGEEDPAPEAAAAEVATAEPEDAEAVPAKAPAKKTRGRVKKS
jgi:hypothetical protein